MRLLPYEICIESESTTDGGYHGTVNDEASLISRGENHAVTFPFMVMRDAQDVEIPPLRGRSNTSLGRRTVTPELKWGSE